MEIELNNKSAKTAQDLSHMLNRFTPSQREEMPITFIVVQDDETDLKANSVILTTAHDHVDPCVQMMVSGSYDKLDLNGSVLITEEKLQELQRGYWKAVDADLIVPKSIMTED